jgi:hypothetical protein
MVEMLTCTNIKRSEWKEQERLHFDSGGKIVTSFRTSTYYQIVSVCL